MRSSRSGSDSLARRRRAAHWPGYRRAFSALWLAAFVLLAPAAGAASSTIDDFESGDFSVSGANGSVNHVIVAVATAFAGRRQV